MHPDLVLSRVLRTSGASVRTLERSVRDGSYVRIRPGAAIPRSVWETLRPEERHRVAMDALAATSRSLPVFAVESAAALHGIPLIGAWPKYPRVAVRGDAPRRARVATSVRWEPVTESDVVDLYGMLATSAAHTALALAAERDLEAGVAAIDDVIHRLRVTREELLARVTAARPFRGVGKVDAAMRIATGRAESVLESLSIVRFRQLGFPIPEQQVEFLVDGARYRVDFYWPGLDIIGEADGRSKYDTAASDVVWAEKQREDALRSVVKGFARWNWDEAWAFVPLVRKLERAGLTADPRNASKFAFRMRA